MSKKLLAFFLNELKIIRTPCSKCQGVIELPINRLSGVNQKAECPVCGNGLRFDSECLRHLGEIITELSSPESAFKEAIEFVIPQEPEGEA